MKSTDFSNQFPTIWGISAETGTITYPVPSSSNTPGRATLSSGFTSTNMTPIASGGIPPFGQDFNGILRMLSTSAQNYEAGNIPIWSLGFAENISGYPMYAVVQYNGLFYTSTADNNTTIPGTSGALWKLGPLTTSSWSTVHGTPGYRISPDGEIEMWGIATAPSTGNTFSKVNINFPFAFPNMCYGVHPTSMNISNSNGGWPSCSAVINGTSGASITAEVFGNTSYTFTQSVNIYWTARGY